MPIGILYHNNRSLVYVLHHILYHTILYKLINYFDVKELYYIIFSEHHLNKNINFHQIKMLSTKQSR